MEKKFTHGPWSVGDDDKNGQAVVCAEHIEIATCWHHCVGSIEKEMRAERDARPLIAEFERMRGGTIFYVLCQRLRCVKHR